MKRGARAGPPRLLAGRFQVVSLCGIGPHGVVHKVYDQKEQLKLKGLKVSCALKIIEPSLLVDKQIDRHHFELVTRLRRRDPPDKRIAMPYEFLELGPLKGYLGEYVEGLTIDHYLASRTLRNDEASNLLREITGAVGRLHEEGIVHGYLHPHNILITDEGRVKITDTGWCNLPLALIAHRYLSPLYHYLAPEFLLNFGCDRRADVYSLGCLAILLLTRIETLGEIPRGFLTRATHPSPEKRFPTVDELAFEFEELVSPIRVRAKKVALPRVEERIRKVLNFVLVLLILAPPTINQFSLLF